MKPVKIRAKVHQTEEGRAYDGTISFDRFKFRYSVKFNAHLNDLLIFGPEILYYNTSIEVSDMDNKQIELDEDGKVLFFNTATRLVSQYHLGLVASRLQEQLGDDKVKVVDETRKALKDGVQYDFSIPRVPKLESFLGSYTLQKQMGEGEK